MALLGLGYAGFGSEALDDWRQFGTGMVGLQAVERGNSLLAFGWTTASSASSSTAPWAKARASSAGKSQTALRWMRWRPSWKRPACRSRPSRKRWPMPGASAA